MGGASPVMARTLLATCLALAAACARAELRAEAVATDPPTPAILVRDQPFHVRIAYAGAEGHHLWARPYFRGEPVTRAKFNASFRHDGEGVALGWFSLDAADAVDEVRIVAGGGTPFREFPVHRLPVEVRGTGFMLAVLGIAVGGAALPAWAVRRWRGGWRIAAALPLAVLAFVAGRIVVDAARDPTSHNLWPFEILMAGGAGLVFLAVVFLARKATGAR